MSSLRMGDLDSAPNEPITERIELHAGGTLFLSRFFDGNYSLAIEHEGSRYSLRLASADVKAIREATGALVLDSLLDVVR